MRTNAVAHPWRTSLARSAVFRAVGLSILGYIGWPWFVSLGGSYVMWDFAWQNLVTRPARMARADVGLTIPIPAFFGLFRISRGVRDLDGGTITPQEQGTWPVPSRRRP